MSADAGGGSGGRSRAPIQGVPLRDVRPAESRTGPPTARTQPSTGVRAQRPAPLPPRSPLGPKHQPGPVARLGRGFLGFVGRTLAVVLPLLLLAVGLLYLKLINGPLSVRFLVDPIERALNAELQGLSADIEDAVLRLSDRGGLEFRLKNLRLKDGTDDVVAAAKFAGIELSTRALRSGRLVPSRVNLIDPEITVSRSADGKLAVRMTARNETATPRDRRSGSSADSKAGPPAGPSPGAATPDPAAVPETSEVLGRLLARMRQAGDAASRLEAIGLRNATLIIEDGQKRVTWKLPSVDITMRGRRHLSSLALEAEIISGGAPWQLAMQANEDANGQSIKLALRFYQLVPREVLAVITGVRALDGVDIPLSGTGTIELAAGRGVQSASLEFSSKPGNIYIASLNGTPLAVEAATARLAFDGNARRFELTQSEIRTREGRLLLAGHMAAVPAGQAAGGWDFEVRSIDGELQPPDRQSTPMKIDRMLAKGRIDGGSGSVSLAEMSLKAGAAEITMSGQIGEDATLDGRIGPMPLADLKTIWPSTIAPRARAFALQSLTKGAIRGGTFKLASSGGGDSPKLNPSGDRRLSIAIEAGDIEIEHRKELPPLQIPRALLRVEGNTLEVTMPEASVTPSPGRRITLRGGRATVVAIDNPRPVAEISFRATGPVAALVELAERDPSGPLRGHGLSPASVDGKLDAQLKLVVSLGETASPGEARIEGRARVTDGRVKDVVGPHDINGATLTFDFADKGIDLKGDALLAGVNVKIQGQLPYDANEVWSSPATITARLDNADRAQLGIDLESIVQGETPIQITIQKAAGEEVKPHVLVDLTPAELTLDEIAWKKPVGRPARLEFDVGRKRQTKTVELQNFKLTGENIAIDGWVGLGPDNKAREYYFPAFSVNVVTNLEIQGVLRPDRVWDVKVQGKTLDGADMFRSLFAIGASKPKPLRKNKPGVELSAEIDTVTGANDTAIRQVRIKASKRADQLVGLDMKGTLDGGKPLVVSMQAEASRPRTIFAETTNAGQALKTIGFYPNMVGGDAQLEIYPDARGAVEKAGRLRVQNFRVLGDSVVSEVFQVVDDTRPAIANSAIPRQRLVRQEFQFESLDAAFAVGNAQVVVERAVVLGPLIGASLTGKLDFKAQRMQLGGTYVPLSGLSRAIGQIPVIGQILTGLRGEGLLGITYAIEGNMANPQVIVNPLAMVAPGILREIFQMVPENQRVTPRLDGATRAGESVPQIRASPPTEVKAPPERAQRPPATGEVIDGWSTIETRQPKRK